MLYKVTKMPYLHHFPLKHTRPARSASTNYKENIKIKRDLTNKKYFDYNVVEFFSLLVATP